MQIPKDKSIVLFDGVCNLCNGFVQFTLKYDKQKKILLGALQSEGGQRLLRQYNLPTEDYNTFVWVEQGSAYIKSTAILRYLRALGGVWRVFYLFIIVPIPLRDWGYELVARNRYKWFGQRNTCLAPNTETLERFLI